MLQPTRAKCMTRGPPTCRHPRTPRPPRRNRQTKSVGDVISLQAVSPESRSSRGEVACLLLPGAERSWPQRDSRDAVRQDGTQKREDVGGMFRALNRRTALETAEGENLDSDHPRRRVRRCGPSSDTEGTAGLPNWQRATEKGDSDPRGRLGTRKRTNSPKKAAGRAPYAHHSCNTREWPL